MGSPIGAPMATGTWEDKGNQLEDKAKDNKLEP